MMKTEQLKNSERDLVDLAFKRLPVIFYHYSQEAGSRLGYADTGHPCGASFDEDIEELQNAFPVFSRNESLLTTEEAVKAKAFIKEAEELLKRIN